MHWYAVSVKPHHETHAQRSLQRLEVETFCPQLKRARIVRRKHETTITPLFPGYLFARFHFQKDYRAVSYARGVRKIVEFGASPATVDDEIIAAIKSRVEDGYVTVPAVCFSPGQTVRITEGPLQGLHAIFEREMSDHERVILLLRALSFQARVIVDSQYVVNL
jgi:transcriptional antiterminator RfaH